MKVYIRNQQRSKRLNERKIQRDLNRALHMLGLQKAELSILFVNSRRMRILNAQYRGRDAVTDVLSFPLSDTMPSCDEQALGDIVVCIPRAESQAADYAVSFSAELNRLLIHGLLHLVGYDHEINAYQRKKMEAKERELLNAL